MSLKPTRKNIPKYLQHPVEQKIPIKPSIEQNENNPQIWMDITKARTSIYPKQQLVNDALRTSTPPKTTSLNIIESIFNTNYKHFKENKNPLENPPRHGNLMSLLYSKDLIRISYSQLGKNKGALTPGVDPDTPDSFSEEKIDKLHQSLKNKTFKWSPTKRVFVPKPGKTKKRPLGIPNFNDKIVQNNIKLILTAIYEPEFEFVDANYGFRPNKGCMNPIRRIRLETHGMDTAIEADIVGAYDNVNHKKLKEILNKRISDQLFLSLIYSGLKAGIMVDGTFQDSFLGTPQGGIASPILFNIYMNEFDKFIKFDPKIQNLLTKTSTVKTEISRDYSRIEKAIETKRSILLRIKQSNPSELLESRLPNTLDLIKFYKLKTLEGIILPDNQIEKNIITIYSHKPSELDSSLASEYESKRKITNTNLTVKNIKDYTTNEQNIIKTYNNYRATLNRTRKILKEQILIPNPNLATQFRNQEIKNLEMDIDELTKEMLDTTRLDPERKQPGILYLRYADDWILFTRGDPQLPLTIKEIAEHWLEIELELSLSEEKTKITIIKKQKAHFLGFEIFRQKNPKIIKKLSPSNVSYNQRYGTNTQVMPDIERLTSRFKIKNYINKDEFPLSVGSLTVLEPHQIVEKFNQFMMGIGNYYAVEIDRLSSLNKWHYFLYYSCLKTLAHKQKSSIAKIITKYGYLDISDTNRNKNPNHQKTAYNRRIVIKYQLQKQQTRYFTLLNYKEFMMKVSKLRERYRKKFSEIFNPNPIDFNLLKKVNWRTKFKLTTACTVCGSTTKLQNHHIRHMKGMKYTGFDKTIASLNRKQITVCENCHNSIHNGEYNKMSLSDIYDTQLAIPENKLKITDTFTNKTTIVKSNRNITIDENNKTYFNPELSKYLQEKEVVNQSA
jgi:retron-type reverse transcriptase